MPTCVTGFAFLQGLLRRVRHAPDGLLQEREVADRALRLVLLQQLLRFEVGDRRVVLVQAAEHDPRPDRCRPPPRSCRGRGRRRRCGSRTSRARRTRPACRALAARTRARTAGRSISFAGAMPPPISGWPSGGVTSAAKVESVSLGGRAAPTRARLPAATVTAAARASRRVGFISASVSLVSRAFRSPCPRGTSSTGSS